MFKKNPVNDQNFQDACVSVVQAGDLQALKNLLSGQGRVGIDTRIGRLGLTFLHLAVIFEQVEVVRWLLENKAKVNKKESYSGKTPLHMAAYYGRSEVLELLMEYSKSFSSDKAGCFPVHYACMNGHLDIVKKLISKGSLGNVVSQIGSPLDIAVRKQNLQLIDFLSNNIGISCVEPFDPINDYDQTLMKTDCLSPLHLALSMKQKEIAIMLLEKFPQFPSREIRNLWDAQGVNNHFFSLEVRDSFLKIFFSSHEATSISTKAEEWRDFESSRHQQGSVSRDLFQAILNDRIDVIKEIVAEKRLEALSESPDPLPATPMRLAIEVCYFPLFDWLIEKRYFPQVFSELLFFQKWCFMDYEESAGGFFQVVPKELQVLHSKYHVIEEC